MTVQRAMTAQQAEALAELLVRLRPGDHWWTKDACMHAVTRAGRDRTNDAETLIRASVRAALTAKIRTPDVIPMPGDHWGAATADDDPRALPNPVRHCTRCNGYHRPATPGDTPCQPFRPASRDTAQAAIDAIRRRLRTRPEETA